MAEDKKSLIISNLSKERYGEIMGLLNSVPHIRTDPEITVSYVKTQIPETEKMTPSEFTEYLKSECMNGLEPIKQTLDKTFGIKIRFGIEINIDDPDNNLKLLEETRDDIPSTYRCKACNEPMTEHQGICLNCGVMKT